MYDQDEIIRLLSGIGNQEMVMNLLKDNNLDWDDLQEIMGQYLKLGGGVYSSLVKEFMPGNLDIDDGDYLTPSIDGLGKQQYNLIYWLYMQLGDDFIFNLKDTCSKRQAVMVLNLIDKYGKDGLREMAGLIVEAEREKVFKGREFILDKLRGEEYGLLKALCGYYEGKLRAGYAKMLEYAPGRTLTDSEIAILDGLVSKYGGCNVDSAMLELRYGYKEEEEEEEEEEDIGDIPVGSVVWEIGEVSEQHVKDLKKNFMVDKVVIDDERGKKMKVFEDNEEKSDLDKLPKGSPVPKRGKGRFAWLEFSTKNIRLMKKFNKVTKEKLLADEKAKKKKDKKKRKRRRVNDSILCISSG